MILTIEKYYYSLKASACFELGILIEAGCIGTYVVSQTFSINVLVVKCVL